MGSRTRDANDIPGVWEYSLTTRPINELLGKIEAHEQKLLDKGVIPTLVVCGAGCAGIELSMSFKHRWMKVFKQEDISLDINVEIVTDQDKVLPNERDAVRSEIERKLKEKNITVHTGQKVREITEEGVVLEDGTLVKGNSVVWSTGAEPQKVTANSDLETSKGYFRVNEFL